MRLRSLFIVSIVVCPLALAARAQNLDLPAVPLPASEPTAPSLWFTPAELASVQARRASTSSAAHYNAVKGFVNGNLAGLKSNPSGQSDDTLTLLTKGAGLLQALGETPPANTFATYRDAAVSALTHVANRETTQLINNPSDAIDALHDSPRLQSMCEGYDLLRGSGVSQSDDTAMRNKLDQWAQALHDDYNLVGLPSFGIPGHRDNWGIKAGSALITCALAMSSHAHASGWMTFGNTLVHDSFAITGSDAGWYRESAHYLNYALDDAFSTAVHVKKRTGVDWFAKLSVYASAALDLRQPDGSEADFEEGVPCVFPFDVFAPFVGDLGGQLAWAWSHSSKDTDSWPNQQFAEATQFLAGDLPDPIAPAGRPSRFVGGDAHIAALRSGFDSKAVQATLFNARDYSNSTLVSSRHDMQNPLDFTLAAL
ncbi:MAG: hypothetical protein JST92_00335, partial [Deltaproteobacteria bacterium]|nr:hypothetical protein [Deltaproteobacteria bacterium]